MQISADYKLVIASALLNGFTCYTQGYVYSGLNRSKLFTKERLSNLNEVNRKEFGRDIPDGGYPDDGNGRYSDLLSLEEWHKFNCGQRIHHNFLE